MQCASMYLCIASDDEMRCIKEFLFSSGIFTLFIFITVYARSPNGGLLEGVLRKITKIF